MGQLLRKRFSVFGVLVVILSQIIFTPFAGAADKVTVCLQWVHQAQFAGFYVAKDAGIYKRYGLEVKIRPGGPNLDPIVELGAGRCQFATAWLSEAIDRRARAIPVVHLAQIVQRSAMLLVTFAKSGVKTVHDLKGRRVGVWIGHSAVAAKALFKRLGIEVKEVPQGMSMVPFLFRAVAAATAMLYNGYHQLYQAGVDPEDLKIFEFAKLGLNFPEDGIYTLEGTWRRNPGLCRRFVAATLAGWRRAFARPKEAIAAVMRRVRAVRMSSNQSHQEWMLGIMKKIILHRVGPSGLGRLSLEDFANVNRILVDQGMIPAPVEAGRFVTRAWKAK